MLADPTVQSGCERIQKRYGEFFSRGQRVIPFFCYLALGYTMKIKGVVSEEFLQKLNQMVFRVFYPFMTFYNIYKADAESLPRPRC